MSWNNISSCQVLVFECESDTIINNENNLTSTSASFTWSYDIDTKTN